MQSAKNRTGSETTFSSSKRMHRNKNSTTAIAYTIDHSSESLKLLSRKHLIGQGIVRYLKRTAQKYSVKFQKRAVS